MHICCQIAELKTQFQDTHQPSLITDRNPNICDKDGPEIFHGHVRSVSQEEIIASLPSKDIVDMFVTTYFSHRENVPSMPIPHKIRVLRSLIM